MSWPFRRWPDYQECKITISPILDTPEHIEAIRRYYPNAVIEVRTILNGKVYYPEKSMHTKKENA